MNKIDYEKERKKQMKEHKGRRLLLHSCCAPCSSGVLYRLIDDFDITVYFYNPNMDSEEEYQKRAKEQERYLQEEFKNKVNLVIPPYNKDEFLTAVKGLESEPEGGARCEKCFRVRFASCVKYAEENGFDFFTTTLTVSPYKNATLINSIGENVCKGSSVNWLYCDFKKDNGYIKSIENSKKHNLYRQDYCGCEFSLEQAIKRRKDRL